MYTEEEAEKLICPLNTPFMSCKASKCMAWRWYEGKLEKREFHEMGKVPTGDGWICELSDEGREQYAIKSRWTRRNPNRTGYCNIAGKPE